MDDLGGLAILDITALAVICLHIPRLLGGSLAHDQRPALTDDLVTKLSSGTCQALARRLQDHVPVLADVIWRR